MDGRVVNTRVSGLSFFGPVLFFRRGSRNTQRASAPSASCVPPRVRAASRGSTPTNPGLFLPGARSSRLFISIRLHRCRAALGPPWLWGLITTRTAPPLCPTKRTTLCKSSQPRSERVHRPIHLAIDEFSKLTLGSKQLAGTPTRLWEPLFYSAPSRDHLICQRFSFADRRGLLR